MKEPSRPTVKRLFTFAGNQCAFRKCTTPIVEPSSGSIVCEICHIKGEKQTAARFDPSQSDEERQSFENLILLCGTHHKVIDDDEVAYTFERVRAMKAEHEAKHKGNPEIGDELADRLVANMTVIEIANGSIIHAQNQTGGQAAHSITNIHLPGSGQSELALSKKLQDRNLDDPKHSDFGKTRYSVRIGTMGKNGMVLPLSGTGSCFASFPNRIVAKPTEAEFLMWMDSKQRKYEPFPKQSFLPSPRAEYFGKAHFWHDGDHQTRCFTRYLAVELDGFLEYGFHLGGIWEEADCVYYAKIVGDFVAFLHFLRELCDRFDVDPCGLAVGLALRGTQGKRLLCITEKVMAHYQRTVSPKCDGLRYLRQATPEADWTVTEVAREAAEEILDLWSYSSPNSFDRPEFRGEQYVGEFLKTKFSGF